MDLVHPMTSTPAWIETQALMRTSFACLHWVFATLAYRGRKGLASHVDMFGRDPKYDQDQLSATVCALKSTGLRSNSIILEHTDECWKARLQTNRPLQS